MATLDMPYIRLYRNKTKDTASLRTDDILGAKPRRAVRDRDPEAFEKMTQLKKFQQNGEGHESLRNTNKNLDHYHRIMSNLPGGIARWEGMYNSHKGGSMGMKDALTHYETPDDQPNPEKRDLQYVKAPFFREEPSSPPSLVAHKPKPNHTYEAGNTSFGAKRFAAESSLNGIGVSGSPQYQYSKGSDIGQLGIQPEKLPSLPPTTRFRSPQPLKSRDTHDMVSLMAHQ